MKALKSLLIAVTGALALLGMSGCATTDENMSERPWNAPKNWETGMPSGMMQGR